MYEYGLFLAKTITFVIAVVAIIIAITSSAMKQGGKKGELEIIDLSEQYIEVEEDIIHQLLSKEELKEKEKKDKKAEKEQAKIDKKDHKDGSDEKKAIPRLFVVDFNGSIDAKEVGSLREEISAILTVAQPSDEVFVRLESGGGMVHGYGLAASQLDRVRQRNIPLTASVDKVAASGGYMMACVANKIVSAPFAILGSIGVIAQVPNFHKLLKKNDVDFEQFTAGEFKRTVTMFGENTDKGREKFAEDIEDVHVLFKEFVTSHRPQLNVEEVATGEIWFGQRALGKSLVDGLMTSDEYISNACEKSDVFEVKYKIKKSLPEKLGIGVQTALDNTLLKWWDRGTKNQYFS